MVVILPDDDSRRQSEVPQQDPTARQGLRPYVEQPSQIDPANQSVQANQGNQITQRPYEQATGSAQVHRQAEVFANQPNSSRMETAYASQVDSHQYQALDMNRVDYKLHILESSNYVIWKQHTMNILEAKCLLDMVVDETAADARRERQARALLTSALSSDNQMKVINCKSAYKIWKRLEAIYENKSSFEKENLLIKFHGYQIKSLANISQNIGELESIAAKLTLFGEEISEDTLVTTILRALPRSCKTFITIWKGTPRTERTVDNLLSRLMAEVEDEQNEKAYIAGKPSYPQNRVAYSKARPKRSGNFISSNLSSSPRTSQKDECYFCNKVGHWKKDCIKFKNSIKGTPQAKPAYNSSSPRNRSASNVNRKNNTNQHKAHAFLANQSGTFSTWVVDGGASVHITYNRKWICDYETFDTPIKIALGNQSFMEAFGKGKVEIKSVGYLSDVYYAPDASNNLISESSCALKGIEILTRLDRKVFIIDGEEILISFLNNGIYVIDLEIVLNHHIDKETALLAGTLEEWHKRFAHVNANQLIRMAKNKTVNEFELQGKHSSDKFQCEACVLSKCKKTSHPLRNSSAKAKRAGMSLHFDTVGPITEESLNGSKYFTLCKDEYSGYRMITFVRYKSDIASEVKQCISQAELDTSNKVLRIVTDNGSEFMNNALQEHLVERGIIHDTSVAYTPEQNGYIERDIRTIFEAGRTILIESKLPESLWAEAMNTAVYVLNRTCNHKSDRTPYELWMGSKPSVKHLRKFGQEAIILKPDHERKKLESKGEKVRFVGYTNRVNTFRFYCPEDGSLLVRCDATFLEERKDKAGAQRWKAKGKNKDRQGESITVIDKQSDAIGIDIIESEESSKTQGSSKDDSTQCPGIGTGGKQEADRGERSDLIDIGCDEDQLDIGSNPEPLYENVPRNLYRGFHTRRPPEMFQERLRSQKHAKLTTIEGETDPNSYREAMKRSDKRLWRQAMQEEIDSLLENKVWVLVDRPRGANIVTNRWVLRIKRKPSGEIERYRARLVARGFSQKEGIDYNETYAPVVNTTSVRLLLAHAAVEKLRIAQFDVKTAFLYGSLDELIYMEQPEGFEQDRTKVCMLKRSLYGLKQAPRMWNKELTNFLKEMNLNISSNDECIFYRHNPLLIMAIYVDDGIIFARSKRIIDETLTQLRKRFKIHDVEPTTYLGFQIERNSSNEIAVHQASYISKIVEKFNMSAAKPVDSPLLMSYGKNQTDEISVQDQVPYREAIGSLMYAACTTRIDIACAVGTASRKVSDPKETDWEAVKRIFRYLTDKKDMGIIYGEEYDYGMVAYCDADFAGDKKTSRSTTGLVVIYGGGPIHWKSQRQSLVTLSSTEAEVVSLCTTVKDVIWIRKLAIELGIIPKEPTPIYCDNSSAVRISTNLKSSHRTRHMSVQSSYPIEQAEKGEIIVSHVKAENQMADMLTKPTTGPKFIRNRNWLMSSLELLGKSLFMILVLFNLLSSSYQIVFERVTPVVWVDTKKLVDHGPVSYLMELRFADPCRYLHSFKQNIRKKRQAIGGIPIQNQQQNPPQFTQVVTNSMQDDFNIALNDAIIHCNSIYHENIIQQLELLKPQSTNRSPKEKIRRARGVLEFTAGMFLTNILTTVVDKIFKVDKEEELEERQQIVAQRLERLEKEVNMTSLIEQATLESMKSLSEIVTHTQKRLSEFVHRFPSLAFTTNYMCSGIVRKGSILNRMRYTAKSRKIDLISVSELLETDVLSDVIPESAVFRKLSSPNPSVIRMEFIARTGDPFTKVYRVNPFRYWTNLTESPTLVEYVGERYLIHNSSNNCVEAIDEPVQMFVTKSCMTKDKTDKRLSAWHNVIKVKDPYTQPANTSTKDSWPWVYIYCFRLNITIGKETSRCPPYVFKLNATRVWNTTDTLYEPKNVSYEGSWDMQPLTHEVHSVHFQGEEHIIDENLALDKLIKMHKELDEFRRNNIAINIPMEGGGITHASALRVSWWITGILAFVILGILVYKGYKDNHQHEKMMKTVTNGIYGEGTYEMARSKTNLIKHSSYKKDSRPLITTPQVNVTLNGTGIQGATVPPPVPRPREH